MIHVYGQEWPHEEVHICGSKEDLLDLMLTIAAALEHNELMRTDEVFDNSGEGYYIVVDPREPGPEHKVPYWHIQMLKATKNG